MLKNSREPPNVGDRIIVNGIMYAKAFVKKRFKNEKTGEVVLILEWSDDLGESRVNLDDEDEVWYRYHTSN